MENNSYLIAMTGQSLVNGVIHHLINKMMQTFLMGIANIHGRAHPYTLKA
jgi:uncharacterized membrane protein